MTSIEELQNENKLLKQQLEAVKNRLKSKVTTIPSDSWNEKEALSIIVLGASGDLAKKKTFPSLFNLYCHGLIPAKANFVGFARSHLSDPDFKKLVSSCFKGNQDKREAFLSRCYYHAGGYDSASAFAELAKILSDLEEKSSGKPSVGNRVFYMAVPPNVFIPAAKAIHASALSKTGWNRLVVEKPFGHDLASSCELSEELAKLFCEDDLYRIDHYLGKEMVQNLMTVRFANLVFEPLWNRHYISNVQITFKENIGTEGRGGYFDTSGIIRDVMQNHLLQILALVGMEAPVSLSAEHVRDEKVKLLRCVSPIRLSDIVIGQYTGSSDGSVPGYLEDPGVPKDSITPTFATAVLHIHNDRWKGIPFILKCGKALNERKAEIRIQFHHSGNSFFKGLGRNELVLRVQPNEAVYLKMNTKKPGLSTDIEQSELDLTYKQRFDIKGDLPDAYERLIYDVVRGDHNLFVRDDELDAAWRIFTPILHQLEKEKIKPEPYSFGTRGPEKSDELISKYGFQRTEGYNWRPKI